MKKLILTGLLCLNTTGVFAHSKITTTLPENGAEVSEVPENISFQFGKKIRLTKVDMTHLTHPAVSLDLSSQTGFGNEIVIPLDGMGDGSYHIEWRGLGIDGHAVQGEFEFKVK